MYALGDQPRHILSFHLHVSLTKASELSGRATRRKSLRCLYDKCQISGKYGTNFFRHLFITLPESLLLAASREISNHHRILFYQSFILSNHYRILFEGEKERETKT